MEIWIGNLRIKVERNPVKWPQNMTIIRHAESAMNVVKDLLEEDLEGKLEALEHIRDKDIPITNVGEWQAHKTGEYLATLPPYDVIYTSPYLRTRRTAEIIAEHLPYEVPIIEDDRLREKEFGTLHGLSKQKIRDGFPHEYRARKRDGKYNYRLPGGENYPDVTSRMHNMNDKARRDWSGKRVMFTTHQVPYILERGLFEHWGEKGVLALGDAPNCGIQMYECDRTHRPEGKMKLKVYNHIAYDMKDAPPRIPTDFELLRRAALVGK